MEICSSANSNTDHTTAGLLRPIQSTSTQAATSSDVLYWQNCHKAALLVLIMQFGIERMGTAGRERSELSKSMFVCF